MPKIKNLIDKSVNNINEQKKKTKLKLKPFFELKRTQQWADRSEIFKQFKKSNAFLSKYGITIKKLYKI